MTTLTDGAPPQGDTAPPVATPETSAVQEQPGAQVVDGWVAALDEDTRATAKAKGWDKLSEKEAALASAKSYAELQKLSGSALHVPKPDATDEERQQFKNELRKRYGTPETPDGIEFKMPENLPESFVYDSDLASKAKTLLHQIPMDAADRQAVHDLYVAHTAEQIKAYEEQQVAAEQASAQVLEKAWGAPESEAYKENLAFVDRAIREAGGEPVLAELKAAGLIGPAGEVRRAAGVAMMIAKLARQAFAEPLPPPTTPAPPGSTREQRWYPNHPQN